MGQMQGQVESSQSVIQLSQNRIAGDFTGEGIVDVYDLTLIAEDWLSTNSLYDIAPAPDGDGIVNLADFAVLAESWLTQID